MRRHRRALDRRLRIVAAALAVAGAAAAPAAAADHQIGFGIHYWETVDNLDPTAIDSLQESGESYLFAYQIWPAAYFRWEFDLELFDEGFQGNPEPALSPIVYALFGKGLYGGVGVGVLVSEGFGDDEVSDVFYAARAGFNVDLVPNLKLDLHGNYRFDDVDQIDGAGSDSITLGALLRFDL